METLVPCKFVWRERLFIERECLLEKKVNFFGVMFKIIFVVFSLNLEILSYFLDLFNDFFFSFYSDKLFPAYGFGAKLPPVWNVSHEFALVKTFTICLLFFPIYLY